MSDFLRIDEVEEQARRELVDPPRGVQLPWWPRLMDLMGGLRMHEFTVLTSFTGGGKTTMLANLIVQALSGGNGCYVCSAEVGSAMFLIAMYSALESRPYGCGDRIPAADADELILKYKHLLRSARILFSKHDDWIEPAELTAEMDAAARGYGARFLILDNLQFFTKPVASSAERAEQDKTTREFKRLIQKSEAHVFLIAHPRKGDLASVDAIKGSNSISQEADNVWIMTEPDEKQLAQVSSDGRRIWDPTDRIMILSKIRRRGWNRNKAVYFSFDGGTYKEKTPEGRRDDFLSGR